ncbi:MAG: hypothetical protein A2W93_08310 [Bacteroidetes bacterium GWF2_43_63]|nr:MAG: hypothetical protein A2W94_04965 [Bacteroidetes bacterium GWE2_42_42]OFY55611.1 MAG: hypothetical protein A2W93_08310 [Bacteroidetes bacterium GWF2_43_63]HBG71631.1 hypothetical protein [Bacteroidales bacterium]HCB62164.1 hypothetical protein [Bacteroidales bacterium]HCY22392.1 hypothetical protein [Bacteroidales bacterium]
MLNKLLKIINDRNFILILSLLLGFILGDYTVHLASVSVWILAIVMVFATSGFSFKEWRPLSKTIKIVGISFLLNFVVFGLLLLGAGLILFDDKLMITGIMLLVISPPGPSVIPFTAVMKGNVSFAVTGVFGLHLISILVTPLALLLLLGDSMISPQSVIVIITTVIVAPLIISRILRRTPLLPTIGKIRGHVINWGFFLIIMPIVGMSKTLILKSPELVLINSFIFATVMFGGGFLFNVIARRIRVDQPTIIAANLIFTTKSSAFAAVASFMLVPPEAGLPLAMHAVFVTLYFIIFDSIVNKKHNFAVK